MRKSTSIVMAIIVLGFGGMMVAANVALKPLQRYARLGREATDVLSQLQMIEPDSKVFVLGQAGGKKRLASDGWGLLIEVEPSRAVRTRKGRLERLAFKSIAEVSALYHRQKGKDIDWFEVKLLLPDGTAHRSLIRLDAARRVGRPEPPIPAVLPN